MKGRTLNSIAQAAAVAGIVAAVFVGFSRDQPAQQVVRLVPPIRGADSSVPLTPRLVAVEVAGFAPAAVPTATSTATTVPTPTPSATPRATAMATHTPTAVATATTVPTATSSATASPSATPSPPPSATPSPIPVPTAAEGLETLTRPLLAYRDSQGELVTQDLDAGFVYPVAPPEEGIKSFVVSADLSTYAWIPEERPWRLMVKRAGQQSKVLLTHDQLNAASGSHYSEQVPGVLTLSDRGALVAVGPLGNGADGPAAGTLVLSSADGRVLGNPHAAEVTFSPDESATAGAEMTLGNLGPGAAERLPEIAAVARGDSAVLQALRVNLATFQSDRRTGKVAYWVEGTFSWRSDGEALLYAQTRRQVDAQGQCSAKDSVVLVDPAGARTLFELPAVPLGPVRGPGYCPSRQEGRQLLANPVLSRDGRKLVFQVDQPTAGNSSDSSLWMIGADGSGPRKIAEGRSPFWVLTR